MWKKTGRELGKDGMVIKMWPWAKGRGGSVGGQGRRPPCCLGEVWQGGQRVLPEWGRPPEVSPVSREWVCLRSPATLATPREQPLVHVTSVGIHEAVDFRARQLGSLGRYAPCSSGSAEFSLLAITLSPLHHSDLPLRIGPRAAPPRFLWTFLPEQKLRRRRWVTWTELPLGPLIPGRDPGPPSSLLRPSF